MTRHDVPRQGPNRRIFHCQAVVKACAACRAARRISPRAARQGEADETQALVVVARITRLRAGGGRPGATENEASNQECMGIGNPTQASFPFHHANAFADAGHDVQIFLLGEAVALMRTVVANSVIPVGWPPLSEAFASVVGKKIRIHV